MSSHCFNSSIARISAFDRFGLGGLALFRISTTLDRAESIKHLLAKLTWLRPNSTPLIISKTGFLMAQLQIYFLFSEVIREH